MALVTIPTHLENIDSECSSLTQRLSAGIDCDLSIRRTSENDIGPVTVSVNLGIDLEVEPGDDVERELYWLLSCLAGNLGYRVVKKGGA